MTTADFSEHLDCLFDFAPGDCQRLPGPNLVQLLALYQGGTYCDDVDRLYLDGDVCGGE